RLFLYDRKSGATSDLTRNFDRWVDAFAWAPDSSSIYFASEDHGMAPLWRVAVNGGEPQKIVTGFNDEPAISPDGHTIFFSRMWIAAPNEIYKAAIPTSGIAEAQQLSHVNDHVLSQVEM